MDDDYELVSKAVFESMRKENEALKEQLEKSSLKNGKTFDIMEKTKMVKEA